MNKPVPAHYANKGDLTTGPVRGHLVRLSVPMIWGLLAIISFQLVDIYFISLLGTPQLIAIGFTFPVTMVLFSLTIAMGIATSSIVSRQIGSGDREQVTRLATHCLLIAGMAGILLALAGIALIDPVFRALGADEASLPMIHRFMAIWYAGSIFTTLPMVGNSILRSMGDTRSPALIMTLTALLNAALDPLLIFGLYGFPRLEIAGAAVSTVFSYMLATIASTYILYARRKVVSTRYFNFNAFGDSLKRFLVIALPVGLANIMQPVSNGILIGMLAGFGHEGVAAYGIVGRVEAFAFITIMALATGMAPIIGQNWGAGRIDRVRETLTNAFGFAILWSLGVAIILMLFDRAIIGLFTDDPAVARVATLYFWIVPITYMLGNLVQGWSSAFNAMGRPERSFLLITVRLFALMLPLAFLGSHLDGVRGIFLGIAAANLIAGAGAHFYSRRLVRGPDIITASD